MITLIIILVVVVLLGLYVWSAYNSLVKLNVRVEEAWSDVTVQLKRRADLLPNLVAAVKGYAAHESGVFERVTKARSETINAGSAQEATVAEGHLQTALKSLFAVSEAYPQLRASENFVQLQDQLVDTENKIQASRRFYNGGVRDLNTKIKVFPNNVFAKNFGFVDKEFFEVSDVEAISEPPKLEF